MEFSFLLQLSRTFGYVSTSLIPQNARRRAILRNSVELKILIRYEISYKQKCKNNTISLCVMPWNLKVFSKTMRIFFHKRLGN